MMKGHPTNQSGFTLLEIVIALVVTAILSALVLQAMGTTAQRSAAPLVNIQNTLSLQEVMDNITADYKRLFIEDNSPMATFRSHLIYNNTNDDGLYWTPATAFNASEPTPVSFVGDATGCDASTYPGGCFSEQNCTANCTVYRVTLTQTGTGRSLSALFTQ